MIINATDTRHRTAGILASVMLAGTLWSAPGRTQQPPPGERVESVAAIRAAAESFVRSELRGMSGVVSVSAGALDEHLRLVACAGALHAELPSGAPLQTRSVIGVSCSAPVRWSIYVPVTIERHISVLVLRHAVTREARLSAEDVSVETRNVTGLGAAYLAEPSELHGRTAQRTLAAGTTLTVDMLNPDFVVRRGQEVQLLAGSGGIEVRASGRALQDAPAGVRLQVQNLSSLKVVEGVAESADTVRVAP